MLMQFLCIFLLFVVILGFSYVAYRDEKKQKMAYVTDEMLKKPLTNQAVQRYISFLQTAPERNHISYWQALCRAYERIMKEKSIDPRLKKELKKTLRKQVVV
jgi:hypothetical protein